MAKTTIQGREELIKYLLDSGEILYDAGNNGYYIEGKWCDPHLDEAVNVWLRLQFKS